MERGFTLAGAVAAAVLAAQEAPVKIVPRVRPGPLPEAETHAPQLRVDASLVLIPVQVTTDTGAPLLALPKNRFHVFEEGVEQPIAYFAAGDAPVSVGIVFDSSASMREKMRQATAAAAQFFRAANREDEFFLVEFNDRPKLVLPFTPDAALVASEIAHTPTRGRTALFDAVHLALENMAGGRHSRRALLVFSDGEDNRSRRTFSQVRSATFESEVQIYAIGIFDPEGQRRRTPEDARGPQLLEQLARESGGRHHRVDRLGDLPEIAERVGREMRSQYLLGYHPANPDRDGKYRKVTVRIEDAPAGARIFHRQGYYAPAQ
jgi:VWFA-related protein